MYKLGFGYRLPARRRVVRGGGWKTDALKSAARQALASLRGSIPRASAQASYALGRRLDKYGLGNAVRQYGPRAANWALTRLSDLAHSRLGGSGMRRRGPRLARDSMGRFLPRGVRGGAVRRRRRKPRGRMRLKGMGIYL